jgi:hypothetical protein
MHALTLGPLTRRGASEGPSASCAARGARGAASHARARAARAPLAPQSDADFLAALRAAEAERQWEEHNWTLSCAFTVSRGALGSPAALQRALRDFRLLAALHTDEVQARLLLPHALPPAPRDRACDAVLDAFTTPQHVDAMHALLQRATNTMAAAPGTRPHALTARDAALCFLWLAAHTMPACKRATLFFTEAVPPAARAELATIAHAPAHDALVVRACVAQLVELLATRVDAGAADGAANAQFVLRNVVGAVCTLMAAARNAGTVDAQLLAGLRAARRVPHPPGAARTKACCVRLGRKAPQWRDPAEKGRRKVIIEHRRMSADGTRLVCETLLVVHVPKAALRGTLRELLACARRAGDSHVRAFLAARAAQGEATLVLRGRSDRGHATRRFRLCSRAQAAEAEAEAQQPGDARREFEAKFSVVVAAGKEKEEEEQEGTARGSSRVLWATSRSGAHATLLAFLAHLRAALAQHGGPARLHAATHGSERLLRRNDGRALPAADTRLRRFCKKGDDDDDAACEARRERYVARVRRVARELLRRNRAVALTVTLGEPQRAAQEKQRSARGR